MIVAIVITGLSVGGAEVMLLQLLERLDRARFQPHVFSLTTVGEIGPRIAALGIPVEALGLRTGAPNPLRLWHLARRLRAIRADVVHTWLYHADLLGSVAARWAGIRAVAWGIHHSNLDPSLNKRSTLAVARLCARLSTRWPRRIALCSEAAMRSHIAFGYDAGKMEVIPNGFDLARFQPDPQAGVRLRAELGLPDDTPLIGLVGRLDPQKNHGGFLVAMGMLHRRLPLARFVLAGRGVDPQADGITALAARSGILDACHLLGYRADMPNIMAALDVLVSSSHGEAFGNVIGEAMACGVPCVVTDVGVSAHIVGDTGLVVPAGDPAALANAVQTLIEQPATEKAHRAQAARARIAVLFEIGVVVRRYERFYEDVARA
ncbi:glycosyltransferase [Pseudorhodoferax soli]|uniref:Glycosyltransferase involved in cell wall biosynthesis n=1 Tax=Pseudorhodoferax soli TaxID=545864 RepID=A0A368Y6S9_9BURK|nr:glycosyltransferase [Pseudorhodoferax soli]RCW73914.1 glycosyltransferase involved in cell wall biosynthesis [Pseudorhodoferax soli]